jgi:hypothetical protein
MNNKPPTQYRFKFINASTITNVNICMFLCTCVRIDFPPANVIHNCLLLIQSVHMKTNRKKYVNFLQIEQQPDRD